MYCSKCGKWINYEADTCNECKAAAAGQAAPTYVPQQQAPNYQQAPVYQQAPNGFYQQPLMNNYAEPDPTNRTYGIGKAIVSLIFGIFATIFAMVSWMFTPGIFSYRGEEELVLAFALIALPFAVIGIIFGALSIACFKRRKATCAKNIPTLILGIVGLSEAAYGALFIVLSFFMFLLMI